ADSSSVRGAAAVVQGRIDVLINNAGIAAGSQSIEDMDYESWADVLNVNTMGPFRVVQAFLEHVTHSDRKIIVTISSGLGTLAETASGGSIAYRSSKAAVNMVMRALAVDLRARGITCVVASPGWVQTDMGGPGATLTPEQSVSALRRLIHKLGLKDT